MLSPWFVTGFSEGEASFTYSKSSNNIAIYFAIKVTKRDAELINKIYDFFKVGRIYEVKPLAPTYNSGYTKTAIYYKVAKISDLEGIIDHFEKYPLQGEKRARYNIWKEMFFLKRKFREYDKNQLLMLSKQLSSLSPKNLPWK